MLVHTIDKGYGRSGGGLVKAKEIFEVDRPNLHQPAKEIIIEGDIHEDIQHKEKKSDASQEVHKI